MAKTKIEWADKVWNPVTGCTKVSEGCRHCYAERMAKRLAGRYGYLPQPDHFKVTLHPEKLEEPLHWKKPSKIFVDSMSDLFHRDVPDEVIEKIFAIFRLAEQHIFIILTKRPKRMSKLLNMPYFWYKVNFWINYFAHQKIGLNFSTYPNNIWLLISAEDKKTLDERIFWLLKTPWAAVKGVSVEPMLGPVDLQLQRGDRVIHILEKSKTFPYLQHSGRYENKISWVICGCESGPGARPMELDWARSLRDQCQAAGVPFFLKQAKIDGKLVKMPELDGRVWAEYPEVKL